MWMLGLLALVYVIYARSLRYKYVIDDNVKREEYLVVCAHQPPSQEFFNQGPTVWYRLFMIGLHGLNAILVGLLFGPAAGLLFAAHPIGVNGAVWFTGNFYATTAFFTLLSFYFLQTYQNIFLSVVPSLAFYTAALNSTITAISFPFIFLFTGNLKGLWMFLPLIAFFLGRRWRCGLKVRNTIHTKTHQHKFTIYRPAAMVKVVAEYICMSIFPAHLGFFRENGIVYGRNSPEDVRKWESYGKQFWQAVSVIVLFLALGYFVNWTATVFFFIGIGAFSQYKILGQYIAERYLYLPLAGVCGIVGAVLAPYPLLLGLAAGMLAARAIRYTPAFRSISDLYMNGVENFPNFSLNYACGAQEFFNTGRKHDFNLAYWYLQEAILLSPNEFESHGNMALMYILLKKGNEALAHTEKAIELCKIYGSDDMCKILEGQRQWLLAQKPPDAVEAKIDEVTPVI